MEQVLKIVEEFINNYKAVQEKYKDDEIQAEIERSCYFEEVPAQAVEYLIKAYKELEEKYNNELDENLKMSEWLVEKQHRIGELEEENEIIKGNYYTLCADIQMVTSELGFPEDTIIADEMVSMIKDNYIPVSLVEEKIEELNRKIKYEDNEKVVIWLHKQKKVLQELLEKRK